MIDPNYIQTMSRYNAWQNRSIFDAASQLSDDERTLDRGAYFTSIQGTLNHLLWGDQIWMHRFAGTPAPRPDTITASTAYYPGFKDLAEERVRFDAVIQQWADTLDPNWLAGEISWHSVAAGMDLTHPRWVLVTHMFNHQTHHRGQVHAMLTAAGAKPEPTDLPFMPK